MRKTRFQGCNSSLKHRKVNHVWHFTDASSSEYAGNSQEDEKSVRKLSVKPIVRRGNGMKMREFSLNKELLRSWFLHWNPREQLIFCWQDRMGCSDRHTWDQPADKDRNAVSMSDWRSLKSLICSYYDEARNGSSSNQSSILQHD